MTEANILTHFIALTQRVHEKMGVFQLTHFDRREGKVVIQTTAANCLRLIGRKTDKFVLKGGLWCCVSHIDFWAGDIFNALEMDLDSFQLVSRFHHTDKQKFEAAAYRQLHRLYRNFQRFIAERPALAKIELESKKAEEILFGCMIAAFMDEVLSAKASPDPMKKLNSDCDTTVLKLRETFSAVYNENVV